MKVWRVDKSHRHSPTKRSSEALLSPASQSRALSGRNCLLGALLDKVFATGVAVSPHRAVVCSEDGSICLMDDNDSSPAFYKVAEAGFGVSAVTWRSTDSIFVGGERGKLRHFALSELCKVKPTSTNLASSEDRSFRPVSGATHTIALAPLGGIILSLDSERGLYILRLDVDDDHTLSHCSLASRLPGHRSAVVGVCATASKHDKKASFFTFSADGSVNFWDRRGACVRELSLPLPQTAQRWDGFANQMTAARVLSNGETLVSGDKLGTLR